MKHDFLHRLTGRLNDFREPLLNHGQASTAPLSDVLLRQWLGLLDTSTDVHVRALLVAAVAYPEDSGVSGLHVDPSWLPGDPLVVVGANLTGNGKHPPMNCHAPAVFPFFVKWELRYTADGAASLIRGHASQNVPAISNGETLSVEWPADSGIFGNLRLHQAWAAGASVSLYVPPVNYPYASLIREMFKRADAVKLLSARGVAEAANACPNPVRATALLVKALTS